MRKLLVAAALAGSTLLAIAPAQSATLVANCNAAPDDITNVASDKQTCNGYYAGNLLNNNGSNVADQKAALASLGFDTTGFNFNSYQKLTNLNGANPDFGVPLSGLTYIAIHYGNGTGSPATGNVTAFYKLDLTGTSLSQLNLNFRASSSAVLYSTQAPPAVPEPATWAMMLGGFGLLGAASRRRARTVRVAA